MRRSSTGYRGVYQDGGRFAARMCGKAKRPSRHLETAVEAAVASRFVAANEEAAAEEDEDEEEEEEEEGVGVGRG